MRVIRGILTSEVLSSDNRTADAGAVAHIYLRRWKRERRPQLAVQGSHNASSPSVLSQVHVASLFAISRH